MAHLVCVVFAIDATRRSTFLTKPLIEGKVLLERAIRACAMYPTVAVVSPATELRLARFAGVPVVINDMPWRGMIHAFRIASAWVNDQCSLAVVPADHPFISSAHLMRIEQAMDDADLCYPLRDDGEPGYPVIVSPRGRVALEALPDGNSLLRIGDDPTLVSRPIAIDEDWAYLRLEDWDAFSRWRESVTLEAATRPSA